MFRNSFLVLLLRPIGIDRGQNEYKRGFKLMAQKYETYFTQMGLVFSGLRMIRRIIFCSLKTVNVIRFLIHTHRIIRFSQGKSHTVENHLEMYNSDGILTPGKYKLPGEVKWHNLLF